MKKGDGKKLVMFIGALFVAAIFLSSYLSSANTSGTSTSIAPKNTYLAIGRASATITGYGSNAHFLLSNQSNATMESVNRTLSALETAGSISNYLHAINSLGTNYTVTLSGIDAYALQQSIRNITALAHLNITTTAYLLLPTNTILYPPGSSYSLPITFSNRNYSISLTGLEPVGSRLNVSVQALVTANLSVHEMRIYYT
jgi:hypothetical protein